METRLVVMVFVFQRQQFPYVFKFSYMLLLIFAAYGISSTRDYKGGM